MKIRIILLPVLTLMLAHSASAQSLLLGRNLFPEGSYDVMGESKLLPSGWTFPDPNDKPWAAGFRAEAIKGESGTRELRIIHPETRGGTIVTARLPLPAKIERMRINYRILVKAMELGEADPAGNGAGIYVRFYDKDNKATAGNGGWAGGLAKQADSEWQERESVYNVPETATTLELQVMFRSAKGEIRVDDVEIVPVAMRE